MIEPTDWLLLHTKAGKELFAAENLHKQQIEYFLPLTEIVKPNGSSIKRIEKAFFQRYMFARIADESFLRPIRNTRGVSGIVCAGGEPLWVADSDILMIQSRKRPDGYFYAEDRNIDPQFGYAIDEIVKVISCYSPWIDKVGKFKGASKVEGEILMEIDMPNFGKSFVIPVPARSIESVS